MASDTPTGPVTTLLRSLRQGDAAALDRLLPLVYDELRSLARSHLRGERQEHTLGATALVHEAYLRLAAREQLTPEDRSHFFAIAAQAMRRVLIDHARARNRKKRGSGQELEALEPDLLLTDEMMLTDQMAEELILLDAALHRLAQANERAARVVEQRFFAGLTLEETAQALGVSLKTVQRDWILARAWLRKEIGGDLPEGGPPGAGGTLS
jgi:RNA polymerase sigma factor (TIGR02999 family)